MAQRKSNVSSVPFSLSVACRIIEPLEYLTAQNTGISWKICSEDAIHEIENSGAHVVWFNKHLSDTAVMLAKKCKEKSLRIIYDVDDWVLGFPSYSGAKISNQNVENFMYFMKNADVVTVANEQILHEIRPYRDEVHLVTNGFYVEKYWPVKCPNFAKEVPKVVFTNADFIKMKSFRKQFIDVLDDFFTSHPEWSMDYYGNLPGELEEKRYIHCKGYFPYDEHKRRLRTEGYAFSITPLGGLEDIESFSFNCCKNPFKYLDYGGIGIPGIYSCVPIYENCIRPDRTGILVSNDYHSWAGAMNRLASDIELRNEIRYRAFEDIQTKRHIRFSAQAIENIIDNVL